MKGTVRHRERGAALIEFALVLPIVVCVTFMVIDFARAFYVKNVCIQASREGARLLAVSTDADLTRHKVQLLLNGAGIDTTTSTVNPSATNVVGQLDSCSVQIGFNWILPGVLRYFAPGVTLAPTVRNVAAMYHD
jgi:Flp pilus assembly protein TadG